MKKLFLSAVLFVIMYGCGGGSQTFLVEISTGTDDGHVSALTKFLPDTAYGMILNNFEDMGVGVATSGGGDTLTSRVLYRFNLSDWENSNVVLHVYCTSIIGQPGSVEVLVLNDFGSIPNSSGTQPEDVSQWWFLVDSAEVAGEFTLEQGEWSSVSISSSLIETYISDNNYVGIILKLKNEDVGPNNLYQFASYEYAESHNSEKPHIDWE